MADDAAVSDGQDLARRVAELEADLGQQRTLLGRCIVTAYAVSVATLEAGRHVVSLTDDGGRTAALAQALATLEGQADALRRTLEEAVG